MHTQITEIRGGDEAQGRLQITRVLLRRATDNLEEIERAAEGEQQAQLSGVLMNLFLAEEQLQPITFL